MGETIKMSSELEGKFFQRLYLNFVENKEDEVILTHFGELSEDLINNLSERLEQILIVKKCSPQMIKRMFGIVLNGLTNICHYFEECKSLDNMGHIIVKDNGQRYCVSIGNVIDKAYKPKLIEHIDNLNRMERSQIRDLYSRNLWGKNDSPKKNIFVGFNSIAVLSKSKINYGVSSFKENSNNFYLFSSFELEDEEF